MRMKMKMDIVFQTVNVHYLQSYIHKYFSFKLER